MLSFYENDSKLILLNFTFLDSTDCVVLKDLEAIINIWKNVGFGQWLWS